MARSLLLYLMGIDPSGKEEAMRSYQWLGIVMLGTAMGLAMGTAGAGAAGEDIVQMVQNAKTPADHEAIAARYEGMAADARKQAAAHKEMEKSYGSGSSSGKGTWVNMPQHCANIARDLEASAKEYDAIAAAHRQVAQAK